MRFNASVRGIFVWNFRKVIFKLVLVIGVGCISREITLKWMSLDRTDYKLTLIAKIAVGWLACTKICGDPFRALTDCYLIAEIVIESPIDLPYCQRSVTGTRPSQSQRYLIPSQRRQWKHHLSQNYLFITHIVIIFHVVLGQYPGLYHLLYILIASDFVFHDENAVINFSMHN